MKILVVGPPGSGKGTQSERISREYDIPHFSVGEILRDHVARQTPLGLRIKEVMASGGLVTDNLVIEVVEDTLKNEKGWVLDGYPRSVAQAEWIIKNYPDSKKIFLACEKYVCENRIKNRAKESGRPEDGDPSAIMTRFKAYEEISWPGTELFDDMVIINGEKSKKSVFHQIKSVL